MSLKKAVCALFLFGVCVCYTRNYDEKQDFSESLAAMQLNGKGGFIDKTGQEVIPLNDEGAENFN